MTSVQSEFVITDWKLKNGFVKHGTDLSVRTYISFQQMQTSHSPSKTRRQNN
jgi:hypothetical protein